MTDEKDETNGLKNIPDAEPEAGGSDKDAEKEEAAIADENYEETGRRQDHKNIQRVKTAAYYSLSGLVIFGALGLLIIATVWMVHIVAPTYWRWLNPEEVDHVQTLLFSGALSAAITLVGSKLLK